MIKYIEGKKVVLFPIEPRDFEDFSRLHREDKHGYLQQFCLKKMSEQEAFEYIAMKFMAGQIVGFTVMTKEGRAARRVGYVYICDITNSACTVSGVMDKEFVKGLGKLIRKDKYTFSEDALKTLVKWVFESFPNIQRIETDVLQKNGLALNLIRKVGFSQEGILRKYVDIDGVMENLVINSVLREEVQHGVREIEKPIHQHTGVSETVTSSL